MNVSVPSRGMGGFLPKEKVKETEIVNPVSGPSRGLGGFLLNKYKAMEFEAVFPAPIEASGVSYEEKMGLDMYLSKFPAPLEVWVVSYLMPEIKDFIDENVSGPSRGLGSFLQYDY